MYKENPNLLKPKNENAKIWRYMDFTKFMSLLHRSEFFFTRADSLDDPFEGVCPERVIRKFENTFGMEYAPDFYRKLKEFIAINCWHLNEYESAAMWKLYLKSNEGIAIQSTFNKLKNSFKDDKNIIFVGQVQYINYEKYSDPSLVFTYPIMFKRKIYRHERELRAFIKRLPKRGFSPRSKPTFNDGIYVPVNLNILIERIYVAPTTPLWQVELVESLIKKYGLNKEVHQSNLDDEPSLK